MIVCARSKYEKERQVIGIGRKLAQEYAKWRYCSHNDCVRGCAALEIEVRNFHIERSEE